MKDGVAIAYKLGQKLTANGSYVLKFSNYDGYTKTYTFVVDTVAPMVTLEVAKNGEFVNAGVKAHFAKDETAEVFKDGKLLVSYMGGSNVQKDGVYRIVIKDKVLNIHSTNLVDKSPIQMSTISCYCLKNKSKIIFFENYYDQCGCSF